MAVNNISAIERYNWEKKAAQKAAKSIASGLKSAIAQTTNPRTYFAQKSSTAAPKYKENRLTRISMRAPQYIFKQHYGFEGTKKNGVNMRLRGTDVINIALQKANALETLADELTEIRAEEVFTKLNFNTNGR